jgi:hypothetical protein
MFFQFYVGVILTVLSVYPIPAFGGGHEDCNLCHKDSKRKEYELIVKPNVTIINPTTKKPYGKMDALCISSCHNVHVKYSHPVGIVPSRKETNIPKEALNFSGQKGEITCLSCHDPHPENKNYKYLRWPPENKWNLSWFCLNCHSTKGIYPEKERFAEE